MSQNPTPPERVHRRRTQADTQISDAPPRRTYTAARRQPSVYTRIPAPMRMVLAALFVLLFVTMAAAITRGYLVQQEERRRLEAEAAELAQHPLHYAEYIEAYAAWQGIDPALVSAVILNESSFNPLAESYLGARGLMQLMEDTAGWIAHKLDEDDETYTFDKLYDPETNIRYGTWYLGYLNRRFDGDVKKVVCAYHAGQGNVDAWLKKPEYSSDGVTLDIIPTEDTAAYAHRVLNAREVYQKHYFTVPDVQADPSEGESQDAPQP